MKEFKRYLLQTILFCLFLGTGVITFNWRMDPLQFYRRASYPPLLHTDKRFQNPGLAKNYQYNAIALGTSRARDMTAAVLSEKLKLKALNLNIPAGTAREQKLMAEVALRTGQTKTVVWEINFEYLRHSPDWVTSDGTFVFPTYFYDQNPWNDILPYLCSIDTTKDSVAVALNRLGLRHYKQLSLEQLEPKFGPESFSKIKLKQHYERLKPYGQVMVADYSTDNLDASFDANVVSVIRAHPEVKFHLCLFPFSIGYYDFLSVTSPKIVESILRNRDHIAQQVATLPNAELHDFQSIPRLVQDVDLWRDMLHCKPEITAWMMGALATGEAKVKDGHITDMHPLLTESNFVDWKQKTGITRPAGSDHSAGPFRETVATP